MQFLDLDLRNKELEAIYTVDHIRDEDHPLDDFLDLTVNQLSSILHCDMSFVMLYDGSQDRLRLQAVSDAQLWEEDKQAHLERFGKESLSSGNALWVNEMQKGPFRSIMMIPLILKEQVCTLPR